MNTIKKISKACCLLGLLAFWQGKLLHGALQSTAPNNIVFSASTRALEGSYPALYLGAGSSLLTQVSNSTASAYKLARVMLDESNNLSGVLQPLVPDSSTQILINGGEASHPLLENSTLVGSLATLAGKYPLFSLAHYADQSTGTLPTFTGLTLMTDLSEGAALLLVDSVQDENGEAITAVPPALAAGKSFAFAAVSPANSQFNDVSQSTRGVAVFAYGVPSTATDDEEGTALQETLVQIDATDNVSGAPGRAYTINLAATDPNVVAFTDGTPESFGQVCIDQAASLAWDEGLQRLYLGLTGARRDDASKKGGVLGVSIGYPALAADGTTVESFSALSIVDGAAPDLFYSTLPADLKENNNPAYGIAEYGYPLAGVSTAAPTVTNGNFTAILPPQSGFLASVANVQVCLQVLLKAKGYTTGNTADALLIYLRGAANAGGAGIDWGTGNTNDTFITDWNANTTTIFGMNYTLASRAVANSANDLRDAIRARYGQLLSNAKIVNKAYATGTAVNSVFTNALDLIIGFYADATTPRIDPTTGIVQARNDGDDDLAVSIPRSGMMNTSTGKTYLIVQSVMSTSPASLGPIMYNEVDNWLYALPLIPTAVNGAANLQGSLAAVNNDTIGAVVQPYQAPLTLQQMPKRYQSAVRVGGGNPVPGSWVKDLFVQGDSVYVALAGIKPDQQGLFKSTALFNAQGVIIGWSPAVRVMGSVVQTYAAMVDTATANVYALTQTPSLTTGQSGATTGQITQWGEGQANMHGYATNADGAATYALDTALQPIFSQKEGGIHGLVTFDELTYGLPTEQVSMLMAYGYNTVAMVKTGQRSGTSFAPITLNSMTSIPANNTTGAAAIPQNVWKVGIVAGVGPLTCGGIAHNPPNSPNTGWTNFYVGGYNGLAVLSVPYQDDATFLTTLPTTLAGAGFVSAAGGGGVQGTDHVYAVGEAITRDATGLINTRYLQVLTQRGVVVYTIPAAPTQPNAPRVVGPQGAVDGMVLADGTIVASSAGLTFVAADGATQTTLAKPSISLMLQIQVIAARDQDGFFALPATIYVLGMGATMPDDTADAGATASSSSASVQLWRVAVWKDPTTGAVKSGLLDTYQTNTAMLGKARPYAQYNENRLNFTVDGTVWFDLNSVDGVNSDFLRVAPLTAPQATLNGYVATQNSVTSQLDVDTTSNFSIALPQRDTAAGAWLLPGDWGLRINE